MAASKAADACPPDGTRARCAGICKHGILDKDQRDAVARSTIPAVLLGPPLPTLDDLKDDAAWWASNADGRELQVYLMAIFNALPADKQQAFTKHITTRTAA